MEKSSTSVLRKGSDDTAKETVLQVRMDMELEEKAKALYRGMGTSFAEAMCIFVEQGTQENGMSFVVTTNKKSAYSRLSRYADMKLAAKEEGAHKRAMVGKREKTD